MNEKKELVKDFVMVSFKKDWEEIYNGFERIEDFEEFARKQVAAGLEALRDYYASLAYRTAGE